MLFNPLSFYTQRPKPINESNAMGETKRWEDYDTIVCPDGKTLNMANLVDEQLRARQALCHLAPFMQGIIGNFRFIYTFRIPTQATDGRDIFVNPQFTDGLDFTGKVFVMAHEVMHCFLNHLRRGQGHDPQRSNIAADYEVNDMLSSMPLDNGKPLVRPEVIKKLGALIDPKYHGMSYETIYGKVSGSSNQPDNNSSSDKSKNQQQDQQGGSQGSQSGQSGQGSSQDQQGGSQGQSGQSGQGGSQGQQGQQGQQGGSQGSQGGQSGQGGSSRDGNNPGQGVVTPDDTITPSSLQGTYGGAGNMIDPKAGDELAKSEGYDKSSDGDPAKTWEQISQKAIGRGDIPGMLKSKLQGIHNSGTDWKKILRKIVGRSINDADKRQAYANKNTLVTQSRVARTDKDKFDSVDYIMCCVDSSGSMTDEDLHKILAEVYTLALKKKPIALVVVQCDTKIQDITICNNVRDIKKYMKTATVKGRGGTELKPCWDLLRDDPRFKRHRCELFMVFTDGFLDQYPRDVKTMANMCWCIIGNPAFELKHKDSKTMLLYIDDL